MEKRVTLKEIATRSGYAVSTVSMALRGLSKIPETTRKEIEELAESMGYQRDPMLSALAAYRDSHRERSTWRGGLAALTLNRNWDWHAIPVWRGVLASMKLTAENSGYSLNEYNIDDDSHSPQRHLEILAARGIVGLILQPAESFPVHELDWSAFSVLSFGMDPARRFHTVSTDFFRSAMGCVRRAREAGYRRIGLALPEGMLDPRHYREIGAILAHQEFYPELNLYFLKKNNNDLATRQRWIEQNQIEVIIGNVIEFATAPDGSLLPFLNLNVKEPNMEESGYHHPPSLIGETLIHQLHSLIIRGETGIPTVQTSIQIAGLWREGRSFG